MRKTKQWAIAAMAAAALGLAGCGGGGDSAVPMDPPAQTQSAIDAALAAVKAATTLKAVDDAVKAARSEVSDADYGRLQTAANAKRTELEAAGMKTAFDTATAAINAVEVGDGTAAEAIAAVNKIVADALSGVSASQHAMLRATAAEKTTALAKDGRAKAQLADLMEKAGMIDVSDLSTTEKITKAKTDIGNLQTALDAAVDVEDSDKETYKTKIAADTKTVNRQTQMNELSDASKVLRDALNELAGGATAAELLAAEKARTALKDAIDAAAAAADLTDGEIAPYQTRHDEAAAPIATAQAVVDAEAARLEKERNDGEVAKLKRDVITPLAATVGMVNDMSEDTAVTGAETAIAGARAKIKEANITDADEATLLALVDLRETDLMRRKTSRTTAIENRRVTGIVQGIKDGAIAAAMTAVDTVTDTSGPTTVTDADKKIADANTAIDGADIPEAEKEKLRSELARHEGALKTKKASRENRSRITKLVNGITTGEIKDVMDAIKLITPLSDQSTVTDTDAAIAAAEKAIADADIPDANKEVLRTRLTEQKTAFKTAKTDREAGHARGKAMYAAISNKTTASAKTVFDNLTVEYVTALSKSASGATRGDFEIDPGTGAVTDTVDPGPVYLRHGVHSTSSRSEDAKLETVNPDKYSYYYDKWNVIDYTRTTGSGKAQVTDRVKVYNDRWGGANEVDGYVIEKDLEKYFATSFKPRNAGTVTASTRQLSLGNAVDKLIDSPTFQRLGNKTYHHTDGISDDPTVVKIKGTYMGAPGHYQCPSTGNCTVSVFAGGGAYSGYTLNADWYFIYEKGAKVKVSDFDYLYFGWWIREDADGMPAAVSAFYSKEGGGIDLSTDGSSVTTSLRGVASTYKGPAIGVYAINDPDNKKGDGGEFTATATLKALFGPTSSYPDAGLTGTINGFRLKDGSEPNWEVTLNKGVWLPSSKLGTTGPHIDIAKTTTAWSVNGVKAAPAGSWTATLYDETPGTVADGAGGDGNNNPTSALGKFHAERGGTHRMVGAFGAKLQ